VRGAAQNALMNKLSLKLCSSLLVAALYVSGCTSERFDTLECRQMRDQLANQTLTPAQTAEITRNIEKAGCGKRLPGP
jgi:hypothetical protein